MFRIFNHYVPKSYFILLIIEGLMFYGSIYAGAYIRFSSLDDAIHNVGELWPRAVVYLFIFLCTMTAMGMYDRHSRDRLSYILLRISIAFFVALMMVSLIFYIFPDLYIGRGVLSIATALAFVTVISGRCIFNRTNDTNNRRVLVLGAGRKGAMLDKLLRRKTDRRGTDIVGYVALAGEVAVNEDKVINYDGSLKKLVDQYKIDEIVMAVDERRSSFPLDDIVDCRMQGVMVSDFLSFVERMTCKVLVNELDPSWLLFSEGFRFNMINDGLKRALDLIISSLLLVILSPLMLIVALLILTEDRGGITFCQQRVGFNGRVFTIYKLRSMRADAESGEAAQWADKEDRRVTWVGRFIRKFRIDELPQLINVIKGDMSFVGPRPERPEFVNDLKQQIPYFIERHRVKPGITGWAQICYPYGASVQDSQAKLEYDLYYVKHYSLFLDMVIIFQTLQVVLFGKGAR